LRVIQEQLKYSTGNTFLTVQKRYPTERQKQRVVYQEICFEDGRFIHYFSVMSG